MPRPRLKRRISFNPDINYFKPRGVPMKNLGKVEITAEELESFYLRYLKDMDQKQAAESMATSASTYQRILYSAAKKIALALSEGKAIEIHKINKN
jgi:uncharacterized protein